MTNLHRFLPILIVLCAWLSWPIRGAETAAMQPTSVKDFGALGDGRTDDTPAIQRAIDALASVGGTLEFPPGVYIVTSVGLRPGIRYLGYGATIRRPANQGKWVRAFDTAKPGYLWSSDDDSPLLTLEGLQFDGNLAEQGSYQKYELEQAHLLFLCADAKRSGRLCVRVTNCTFRNGVADAISVYTNVEAQIVNCTAVDCFRGGVTITGGFSRVQVANFVARGQRHATGIDVEVDGGGFGGTRKIELLLDNLSLPDGDFDIGVGDHSVVLGTNISAHAPFNLYGGGNSTLKFTNCVFGVGEFSGNGNRIVKPGYTTFSNCRFLVDGRSVEQAKSWACAHIYWSIGSATKNQSLVFHDCEFALDPAISAEDTTYAVYSEATPAEHNNQLTLDGCRIGPEFDVGLWLNLGGVLAVRGGRIDAGTTLQLGSQAHYPFDVLVDSLQARPSKEYLHLLADLPDNRLAHQNVLLESSHNVVTAPHGLTRMAYAGSRTIFGQSAPTPQTDGLAGDVYRQSAPDGCALAEWLCTKTGGGGQAEWTPCWKAEQPTRSE